MIVWLLACGPYVVGALPQVGSYPEPFLVEAEDVVLEDYTSIIDIRAYGEAWVDGHLPGSVPVDLLSAFPYNQDDDPEAEATALAEAFAELGLVDPVLVVGDPADGWGEDGWAWWLLRYAGHTDVTVLHGGYPEWVRVGGQVEVGGTAVLAPVAALTPAHERAATIPDVQDYLERGYVVLDTRTREEWDEGHIPGATFWEHGAVFGLGGKLLDADTLRATLVEVGVTDLDQPVIVYCAGGFRSGHNVWAMELLGHTDVRNFRGSFWTWEAQGLPVETN